MGDLIDDATDDFLVRDLDFDVARHLFPNTLVRSLTDCR